MSEPHFDLSGVIEVSQSNWTMDYFIDPPLPDGEWNAVCDYEPDATLYAAIEALIADWPYVEDVENSSITWRRPGSEETDQ